ncbi:MAG: BlaI/MecI/CopY family transcriptional regulator [Acidobacteriota bacterium]
MLPARPPAALTKRERQIMDVLYRLRRGTAAEIRALLPGSPSDSTVRTQLRVLEGKGYVRHEDEGLRYAYFPRIPRHEARRSALRHLVETFFDGSHAQVVTALLGSDAARLTNDDLDRISRAIESARKAAR